MTGDGGRGLSDEVVAELAAELAEADRTHTLMPRISVRHPTATVADSYAVQGVWSDQQRATGRRMIGRKIGLTSKAMQAATGITEPDYGVMFDDTVWQSGASIPYESFSNVRVEVELAFVLSADLRGPDCTLADVLAACEYVTPALEVLNSHIELEGRTIVDTIADNAAYGAMVLGDNRTAVDAVDLRWVSALLFRNDTIEETGVAAGVLNHPANGVAWLANKLHAHGAHLSAGEIILAGSFTRPMWVSREDLVQCDYGPMGTITCRFD
ncbi:MAG: fumarylacetoacetate hydrolase family protein [Propionibacteriales bacterium]|nr:fumarylacetoacetate hydrolase family protein [Propionibacteriales bacterium]